MQRPKPNSPKNLDDDSAVIILRDGEFAIVDREDYEYLRQFQWRLKKSRGCYYAVRTAIICKSRKTIRMHREIMKTPWYLQCHHKNHDTLDNRKRNMKNLTRQQHQSRHNLGPQN